jgi:hypothetical protein
MNIQFIIKITISLFILLLIQGCRLFPPPPPPPPTPEMLNSDCFHTGNLSPAKRRNKYPFRTAEKVIVVSFHSNQGRVPMTNAVLDSSKVIDLIELSTEQIDDLTNVLYNHEFLSDEIDTEGQRGCYYPRHAILFINRKGKIANYIEICFECLGIKTSFESKYLGDICDGKFDLIEDFFVRIGVKHFEDNGPGTPVPPPIIFLPDDKN